jgi:hypothetical protein
MMRWKCWLLSVRIAPARLMLATKKVGASQSRDTRAVAARAAGRKLLNGDERSREKIIEVSGILLTAERAVIREQKGAHGLCSLFAHPWLLGMIT